METLAPNPETVDLHARRRIGSRTALWLGMSVTTVCLVVLGSLAALFTGGLLGMIGLKAVVTANNLHLSLMSMYAVYPAALWGFGSRLGLRDESKVAVSARFSFGVSASLWLVFLITQSWFGRDTDMALWAFGSVFMALLTGLLSTYTLGLLITTAVRQRLGR